MFGARVFEFWVTRGPSKRTRLDLGEPGSASASAEDLLVACGESLMTRGLVSGVPDLRRPAEWEEDPHPPRETPQLRCDDVRAVGPGQTLYKLKHGYHGEFDEALGRDGAVDISQRAPVHEYRALLFVPESGPEGRLVVETIARTCPITMLVRWLGYEGFRLDADRWLRPKVNQVADRRRIMELIRNAEKVTAELRQYRPSEPGRRRSVATKLTHHVDADYEREGLLREALRWAEGGGDSEYVVRIESIAGYSPEALDETGLRFDDAALVVENDEGRKTIRPDSIRALFTYEFSADLPLDDDSWIASARSLLSGTLSEGTDITI
ncbi:hypothetical protein GCM10025864_00060 [Luteimicrobium album]|uniref:Uncharacterized protein n=1 Tax=Luteimicrobium album TaxID=1054550 RepID=A0ABQ6HW92_9MICO|nr:hypothetical protein [Luteimicrobium album]GMA22247.1 hypothetical protein GCM10025864_00060 [Luteimicrobium album]